MVSRRCNRMVRKIIVCLFILIIITPLLVFSQVNDKDIRDNRKATYYHHKFVNRKTSSGEVFSQTKYTAAYNSLPLHTIVRVTNKKNQRSIIVRINDRCPKQRVIDLTLIAAKRLKMIESGVIPVRLEILNKDYTELWQKQEEIFNLFDRKNEIDSLKNAIFDSIIFSNANNINENYIFAFNIRIIKANNKTHARKIIRQLPNKYKHITRAVKINESDYYNINIGPFISEQTAIIALKEIRKRYPIAHILEKKNED